MPHRRAPAPGPSGRDRPGPRPGAPGRAALDAPAYALPEPALERLARPAAGRPPLLAGDALDAERDLTARCRFAFAAGFRGGCPVACPPLIPPAPVPAEAWLRDHGWPAPLAGAVRRHIASHLDIHRRLAGYAGWLVTEPDFLHDARALARAWLALDPAERPPFPLTRGALILRPAPPGTPPAAFQDRLADALDRWGLVGLADWHLPLPQGPILPDLLPEEAPARPRGGLALRLPVARVLADDELLRLIRDAQRAEARHCNLPPGAADLAHHDAYARMLAVQHLERAIADRFAGPDAPRGLAQVAVEAVADALGLSVERVQVLRWAIAACRRGGRDRIAWLRPRAGRA